MSEELEEKCKGCIAHQYDEDFGDMCVAPVCIKEYEYDPELRIWTPIEDNTHIEDHKAFREWRGK